MNIILSHHLRACNSKMIDQIWPQFELVWDFMPVLVTCKFDEDWIYSNWEKVETSFLHHTSMGKTNLCSRANNSKVNNPIQPKFEPIRAFMPVLDICKFDKDPI